MLFSTPKREVKKLSPIKTLVNIATIVSAMLTCISLYLSGIISIKTAALVILAVVVFVALGNNIAKIILAGVAFILFVLSYSGGTNEGFNVLLKNMITLVIILSGMYFMIRKLFGGSK